MISIRSSADLARALDGPLDPDLRRLLALRRDKLLGPGTDLADVAHIVLACPRDTLAAVEAEVGFPLAGDEAAIDLVRRHPGGWLEAVVGAADDFAVALFLQDRIDADPHLLLALLARA